MSSPYQLYMELQKQANLWLNTERSPVVANKLLTRRIADAAKDGTEVTTGWLMRHIARDGGGANTLRYVDKPGFVGRLFGRQPQTKTLIAVDPTVLPASHPNYQVTLHHELDEARYAQLHNMFSMSPDEHVQGTLAVLRGNPLPPNLDAQLDRPSKFTATVRTRGNEILRRAPIEHYDPAVILHESNRVGAEVSPTTADEWRALRNATGDAPLMTMPYGKVIPEGGREWEAQRRVMSTRTKPILGPSGLDAINQNAPDFSELSPSEAYRDLKAYKKQFGRALGKAKDLADQTVLLRPHTRTETRRQTLL